MTQPECLLITKTCLIIINGKQTQALISEEKLYIIFGIYSLRKTCLQWDYDGKIKMYSLCNVEWGFFL